MNFSKTSNKRLSTCHQDLQLIFNEAINVSRVDFGVAEGHRSIEDQFKYFSQGKSRIDGINKKGKHNYSPSLAIDIYAYVNGKASWEKDSLNYLAGLVIGISEMLYKQDKITHKLRWGGNWNRDGIILADQSFDDLPHFELIKA